MPRAVLKKNPSSSLYPSLILEVCLSESHKRRLFCLQLRTVIFTCDFRLDQNFRSIRTVVVFRHAGSNSFENVIVMTKPSRTCSSHCDDSWFFKNPNEFVRTYSYQSPYEHMNSHQTSIFTIFLIFLEDVIFSYFLETAL